MSGLKAGRFSGSMAGWLYGGGAGSMAAKPGDGWRRRRTVADGEVRRLFVGSAASLVVTVGYRLQLG